MGAAFESYQRSIANLALKNIPPVGSDNQADYEPPPAYEGQQRTLPWDRQILDRENRTIDQRVFDMYTNMMAPELMGPLSLTRGEATAKILRGLQVAGDVPIDRVRRTVSAALRGLGKLADEELAPISDIQWTKTPGGKAKNYGYAQGGAGMKANPEGRKIELNLDFGMNPERAEHTIMEETLHINQIEDTNFSRLMSLGDKYLTKNEAMLKDKFANDAYNYDPYEIHAKYQATKRRKDYPEELAPEMMRDVYDLAGLEHIAKKWNELGKRYPALEKEAGKFAIGVRSYLNRLQRP